MDNKRIVTTNLPNEKKYREILASVIGQMSDGIWENSNKYNGYWHYAECDSNSVDIVINTNWYSRNIKAKNPYVTMSDKEIKNFFANKVKQIALIEMRRNYERKIKEKIYGKYPTEIYRYFRGDINPENESNFELGEDGFWFEKDDEYKDPILTKEQVLELERLENEYEEHLKENPFIKKGKFKADDNIKLVYLSYDEDVTLADAYFVYKHLKQTER